MGVIGVIGGSALLNSGLFDDAEEELINTKYGRVNVRKKENICFIQRHGKNTQPHMINHRANIQAMKDSGAEKIIAISSCGSLKKDIRPGSLMIIDDYMQLSNIPTFFDDKMRFTKPGLSERLMKKILKAADEAKINVNRKGTYFQTTGPRFETKAEIRLFSSFADVVGMTIASEATLANEAGIDYAVICSVDNFAHGIGKDINWDDIAENQKKNLQDIMAIIEKVAK